MTVGEAAGSAAGPVPDAVVGARAYLSRVAEPPAAALARLVDAVGPVAAAERVRSGDVSDDVAAETAARRAVAARQVAAALALLDGDDARPVVLAGDLNLPPWSAALDPLYASHREADRLPRWASRPTHQGLRKLDYVFVPRTGVRRTARLHVAFRPRWSDHARLSVELELDPDGSLRSDHAP